MFRAINERIRELAGRFDADRRRAARVRLRVRGRDVRRARRTDDASSTTTSARSRRASSSCRATRRRRSSSASSTAASVRDRPQDRHRRRGRPRAVRLVGVNPSTGSRTRRRRAPPRRTTGRVDVAIVGAGVTGCSAALRLAERGLTRARARRARRRRGRERPERRLRAARRRDALRHRARDLRPRAGGRAVALDGARARPDGRARRATRSAAPAACVSRPTRRSATRSASSSRRCARTGSRPSGSTIRARRRAASTARSSIRATARCSRRASCAALAARAAEAGVEFREHDTVDRRRRRSTPSEVVVATDGYGHGLVAELRRLDLADARPGDRQRAARPRCSTTSRTTRARASITGSSCPTGGSCSAASATSRSWTS